MANRAATSSEVGDGPAGGVSRKRTKSLPAFVPTTWPELWAGVIRDVDGRQPRRLDGLLAGIRRHATREAAAAATIDGEMGPESATDQRSDIDRRQSWSESEQRRRDVKRREREGKCETEKMNSGNVNIVIYLAEKK